MSSDNEILQNELDENRIFQANFNWEYDDNIPVGFQEWFIENGEHFNSSLKKMPDSLKPRQTTASQCFQNSQLLSQDYPDAKYYEGIMFGPVFKACFHHGFNIHENDLIDLTYIFNTWNYHNEDRRDKLYVYFEVNIPNEFIDKYKEKIKANNVHNPLLFDYFNSVNK
jgi:hypothetical protein